MTVSAFDGTGKYYATSIHNRVQVLDASDASVAPVEYKLSQEGVTVNSLAWIEGFKKALNTSSDKKKKRKRSSIGVNEKNSLPQDDPLDVLAIGTSVGDVIIFAPSKASVLFTLSNNNSDASSPAGIKDISVVGGNIIWTVREDGLIAEWDLSKEKILTSFTVDGARVALLGGDSLLTVGDAEGRVLKVDPKSGDSVSTIPTESSVKALVRAGDLLLVAGEKFILVLRDNEVVKKINTTTTGAISKISTYEDVLAALSVTGSVELFQLAASEVDVVDTDNEETKPFLVVKSKKINNIYLTSSSELVVNLSADNKFETIKLKNSSNNFVTGTISLDPSADVKDQQSQEDEDKLEVDSESLSILSTPETYSSALIQALKTGDDSLLDTCLSHRVSEEFVQVAVRKLDRDLAAVLVSKLTDRINQQPTRIFSLTIWIKWVLLTYGGYLLTLPEMAQSMVLFKDLLTSKMSVLPKLLGLQGRLDMLKSQMSLRKDAEKIEPQPTQENEEEEEQEDDAVLIVNGEEDFDDDDDNEEEAEDEEDEEDDDDDLEEEDDIDAVGQLIDNEAEEDDEDEEEEEEEEVAKPVSVKSKSRKRKSKTNGKSKH
ncbi:hypothetical protein DV452_004671 [Geotrichum candidum]|nr:hypothetical protein DV452_004671 [Geotrichum candidum]KAI9211965.1 hypothetical protein DS838_003179 [Geotrichum bryndzae]